MAGKSTPRERLAGALLDAVIAAAVRQNPHHDRPEWRDANRLLREAAGVYDKGPWLAVAEELLTLGVVAPQAPPKSIRQGPKSDRGDAERINASGGEGVRPPDSLFST